jgi:hypothetical protein
MNVVACRRPGWRGRLAEKLRQTADLEHWPSFRASSDRLSRLTRRIAETETSTVCVLSGDVHHVYAARARFPRPTTAAVYQLVCSPMHNQAPAAMRPLFRLGWWRPFSALMRWLMLRSPHIEPMPVEWEKIAGPYFGNAVATLRTAGRVAELVVERADGDDDAPELKPLVTLPLTRGNPG